MCYIKYYNKNKNNKLIIKYYKYKDIYYRKAKEDGFRARSAYKLIQIDEVINIKDERNMIYLKMLKE